MKLTNTQKRLGWLAVALILLFYVLLAVETAPSFQACTHEPGEGGPGQSHGNGEAPSLSIPLAALILGRCGWRVVSAYGEGITAAFTVVLAISTIMLWLATEKLWTEGKAQRDASSKAAELAAKQFDLAAAQHDLAIKQRELQRVQFFATHRPRLDIRFARLLDQRGDELPDDQPIRAEMMVVNTGNTDAIVLGSKIALMWLYDIDVPIPTNLAEGSDLVTRRSLQPGASEPLIAESDRYGGLNLVGDTGAKDLYLLGWIVYADARGEEFGDRRTTYFGRIYDRRSKLFVSAPILIDWEFTY